MVCPPSTVRFPSTEEVWVDAKVPAHRIDAMHLYTPTDTRGGWEPGGWLSEIR